MSSKRYFYKGRKDAINKRYNPPKKGTSWKNTAFVGGVIGALLVPHAVASWILGGTIGSLFGDSDKQIRRKRSNRRAYHAGHRYKRQRGSSRTKKIVIYR